MFAVEACQISGGDTVIIAHIRICIISDHGIRAALLSAGHMDRTFTYLNSGRIDPYRIDAVICIQPVTVRGNGNRIGGFFTAFLQLKFHAERDLSRRVLHLRSLQHEYCVLFGICSLFIEVQRVAAQGGFQSIGVQQITETVGSVSLQQDDVLFHTVSEYRVLIIHIRQYIVVTDSIVLYDTVSEISPGRSQCQKMVVTCNGQ